MRRVLGLAALALLTTAAVVRAQTVEGEVKAAFLYNFAKFVEWPADAFEGPDDPITFCLAGRDPFGPVLDELLRGERVRGRPLAVRRLERDAAPRGCHILFVSPLEAGRFEALLRKVDTRRVLTVSDALPFLEAGGHVSFYIEASRVRFAVNQEACNAAAFRVSSKLLQLARRPDDGRRPPAP